MSFRYLLLAFGDRTQRRALAAELNGSGELPVAREGLDAVLLSPQAPSPMAGGAPWLIGELFRKNRCVGAELKSGERTPRPSQLLAEHWGRYVAIWPEDGAVSVLRDPSGGLPCYYRRIADLLLVASDLETLLCPRLGGAAVDWAAVDDILSAGDLRTRATAITGVCELLPGELLLATPPALEIKSAWLPWANGDPQHLCDAGLHAETLRERVDQVMTALGGTHRRALVTVSGGLDSSIVALSSRSAGQSIACLTLATADPAGDERRYARAIAVAAGGSYDERFLDPGHVDLRRSQAAHLPRPIGRPHIQATWRHIDEVAASRGVTAIFNGTGGDNVFCFLRNATPVVDRLLAEGIGPAISTAGDVARLTGATYLQVLAAAVRCVRRRAAGARRWRRDRRFLTVNRSSPATFAHPWLDMPQSVSPGTAAHIGLLLRIQNYLDPWAPGSPLDMINPLLAQPIVECCLAIPSWRWCEHGVDRALARRAFADVLPPTILARRWKGGPDSFVSALFASNQKLIRSALLDGLLADRGLLDRAAITAALDHPRGTNGADALRLLALTDAEAWVRAHA